MTTQQPANQGTNWDDCEVLAAKLKAQLPLDSPDTDTDDDQKD